MVEAEYRSSSRSTGHGYRCAGELVVRHKKEMETPEKDSPWQ